MESACCRKRSLKRFAVRVFFGLEELTEQLAVIARPSGIVPSKHISLGRAEAPGNPDRKAG